MARILVGGYHACRLGIRSMKPATHDWDRLARRIVACRRCPRLREYCAQVARVKRRAYAEQPYWGRPVPNLGDPLARLLIVGLAPAAHGANRTGRMFTGDRSGQWLCRALHRAGFASQANSDDRDDGLMLRDCAITSVCHCAPPDNRPLPSEVDACREWLETTWSLLTLRVIVALGQLATRAVIDEARRRGLWQAARPRFAHGLRIDLGPCVSMICCYHPSQQNTFTGRLTEPMLDGVFAQARALLSA